MLAAGWGNAALDGDLGPTLKMREAFLQRRDMVVGLLREISGVQINVPDGAFYVYADVSHLTDDSRAFAAEILDKPGVAVTPGLDFDPDRGAGTLRFSYARSTADIEEGLARLKVFMDARKR